MIVLSIVQRGHMDQVNRSRVQIITPYHHVVKEEYWSVLNVLIRIDF